MGDDPTFENAPTLPISSGRPSVRDLVGRTKTTFRTFQGSRRGGYTVNGPKLEPDFPHESVPLTVANFAVPIEIDDQTSSLPTPPPLDESLEFPAPPEEFYSPQTSPNVLARDQSADTGTPPSYYNYDEDQVQENQGLASRSDYLHVR